MPDRDERTPPEDDSTATAFPPDRALARIGPYKILEEIGEGGMGVVYLAEQEAPLRRRVALKVIKPGMDSKQVLARFEAERQALALMNHPGVAKVFDAGSTPDGRPYFVMEHVAGLPITEYCDKHLLDNRERLELFIRVCEAIQHAHQKGIIHRDIKPSNVLVALVDGKPQPKVIDFGVAKATQQQLTEQTVFTQQGVFIGTPEYMSPEQAEMNALDIDTRSDVYSLGVLLYELLVGALPFEPGELRRAGFDEIRRIIREVEPHRPSTRFSALRARSIESARRRRTQPKVLHRQLQGDLDWITMKALEKDRTRRYGSPSDFAADIGRYLAREPILARPPSVIYRTTRFVDRHRVSVAAGAIAFGTLIGISGVMTLQSRRIGRERDRAQRVSRFLVEMYRMPGPSQALGKTVTASDILGQGAERIEHELADEPELQAELWFAIGNVYMDLGLYRDARPLLERSAALRSRLLGADSPDTLAPMNSLANLSFFEGRYAESESLQRDTLERRRRVLGDDNPDTLRSMDGLGQAYIGQHRYAEAEGMFRQSVERRQRVLGREHPDTLTAMMGLAIACEGLGRYPEAEQLDRFVVDARRRYPGVSHPDTLRSMNHLARVCSHEGHFADAERLYGETIDIRRRVLGENHPETLKTMNDLAAVYVAEGRYADADRLLAETLKRKQQVLGDNHPSTLVTIYELGCSAARRGDRPQALHWLHEVVERGYRDPDEMSTDDDLKSLRSDPAFEALVEQARDNRKKPA